MIIPSIDLMNGHAVQLVQGRKKVLDAGDPRPLAKRFALAGEIAVVDLDAALGKGDNTEVMAELCRLAPCRVGGGIRNAEDALWWLDAGAQQVVLGTAAVPEVLEQLPPERVVAALDAWEGEVVVEGWQKKTGRGILERMKELEGLAGGFLVTFVEKEGCLQGTDHEMARSLKAAAGKARIVVAGGITTLEEIAELDRLGADAQVGMAIYSGKMELADAIAAPLKSDRPDGLWATVVADEHGAALGLAYSDKESLREAVRTGRGVYHSRSRGLWLKGETSGNGQELLRVDLDCDRDAMRFTVRQEGHGFCHKGSWSCWGEARGLPALSRLLISRVQSAPEGSYTRRLLDEPALLDSKLREEAAELADARSTEEVAHEAADLIYFTLVAAARAGVSLEEVEAVLARRSLKVTRRAGDAKPVREEKQ